MNWSIKNGFPSTINCVALPCFFKWGNNPEVWADMPITARVRTKVGKHLAYRRKKFFIDLISVELRIQKL
jgi:hypothetical protein